MKSAQIYKAIRDFCANHEHKFENVYVHDWEADHFSVTKNSAYSYEIEVKISRSDFFADFKKPKHHFFKNYKSGFGIIQGGTHQLFTDHRGEQEYPELKRFKVFYTNIKALELNHATSPNCFYYAMPVGLVEEHEVPKYAGLIYVMDSGSWRVIRKAPYLHKDKFVEKMLFSKYRYRSADLEFTVHRMKAMIKNLVDAIERPESYDLQKVIELANQFL